VAFDAYERGDSTAAIDSYEKSVALDPSDAGAWFNLGIAYQHAGRSDDAIAAYKKSLDLDPKNGDARKSIQALKDSGR
jgi:Flp pilus assembly protein TadD